MQARRGDQAGGPSARTAALDLLLAKSVGEKGVLREGRRFFPLFCDPRTTATWPLDPGSFAMGEHFDQLRQGLRAEPVQAELEALAGAMGLEWSGVKVVPGPPSGEADARCRLRQALDDLEQDTEADLRLLELVRTRPGEWAQIKGVVAGLAVDRLRVPRTRRANRDRTFAALVFTHARCCLSRDLLLLIMERPLTLARRSNATEEAEAEAGAEEAVALEPEVLLEAATRVAQELGADPIRVAWGSRGYVFPAFTALAPWQPLTEGLQVWKESDIAAFKEALKTLNQQRLKLGERLEARGLVRSGLLSPGGPEEEPLLQEVLEQLEWAEQVRDLGAPLRPPRTLLLPTRTGPLFIPGSASSLTAAGTDAQGRVHTTQVDLTPPSTWP